MVEAALSSHKSGPKSQAETVLVAILDVHQPKDHEVCEVALVLFTYDLQYEEVLRVTDSYAGHTRWIVGEILPAEERRVDLSLMTLGGESFDTLRVAEMLERPEFLIAHNAEFAQSFVCRIFKNTRIKHWKCSKKDIDWARLGMQSSEFDWLLEHHQIEMNSLGSQQNGALALLHLLRLRSSDGRPYLSHLLQE